MGYQGVSATAHYDVHNNQYIQLYGKKRFLLASPAAAKSLYLFPAGHPSHRQSQIQDLDHYDPGMFPLLHGDQNLTFYEVVLSPGDMLYFPAFWFHFVSAVKSSVSINLWSESNATKLMMGMVKDGMAMFNLAKIPVWKREQLLTIVPLFTINLLVEFFGADLNVWPEETEDSVADRGSIIEQSLVDGTCGVEIQAAIDFVQSRILATEFEALSATTKYSSDDPADCGNTLRDVLHPRGVWSPPLELGCCWARAWLLQRLQQGAFFS